MSALPDLRSVYKVETGGQTIDSDWAITMNPRSLLAPPAKRGSSLVIPRGNGAVALRRRLGVVTDSLRILIIGDVKRDGTPAVNPANQLLDNLAWFEANIYSHAGVTASLKVTGPGGFIRQGQVQWLSFDWGDADTSLGMTTCRAVMRFEIPQRLTA